MSAQHEGTNGAQRDEHFETVIVGAGQAGLAAGYHLKKRFEADHVIVASGAHRTGKVAAFARQLDPRILQVHSSDYRIRVTSRRGQK